MSAVGLLCRNLVATVRIFFLSLCVRYVTASNSRTSMWWSRQVAEQASGSGGGLPDCSSLLPPMCRCGWCINYLDRY